MRQHKFMVLGIVVLLAAGTTAMAQTVTVSKSGSANFTSVQAAINSINATNGQADIINILDSATYEEQIVIGGLPPIDAASGTFISNLAAQNRDAIIIRGPATGERPKLAAPSAGLVNYGVFEENPDDNFKAGVVYFGKNITLENVAIYQPGQGSEAYGINGQGVGITFKNCLFQHNPNSTDATEDFYNMNNSAVVADLFNNVPNDVLFDGCVFDGAKSDGSNYDNTMVYYHGTNEPGLDENFGYNSTIKFAGCTFKNFGDNLTRLRSRQAGQEDIRQEMLNCKFIDNVGNTLSVDGGGVKIVDGCLFSNNTNGEATSGDTDRAALYVRGRDGRTGDVTIKNTIFTNNASRDAFDLPGDQQWAAVYVTNDTANGIITVDHCTFDGNSVGIRFADGSARARTANVSNSIFSNNVAAGLSGDSLSGSYVGNANEANLALTMTNCLFFNNGINFDLGTASGSVNADPMYANTDANAAKPFALGTGSPAIGAALDGTDIGAQQTTVSAVDDYMIYN